MLLLPLVKLFESIVFWLLVVLTVALYYDNLLLSICSLTCKTDGNIRTVVDPRKLFPVFPQLNR